MKIPLRPAVAFALLARATICTVSAATLYVSLDSTNPIFPYATWATAAANIERAVDMAKPGDTVLVTNGVYDVGVRDVSFLDTNSSPPRVVSMGLSRVVITNSIRLESVNGPLATAIVGGTDEGVRCVYLGTNAVLSGFTLTNGYAGDGGGVFCEPSGVVTNCVLTGNRAGLGGGAYGGTLYNCTLTGNSGSGGGACGATLYNCTLTGNNPPQGVTLHNWTLTGNPASAAIGGTRGGGAYSCTLYNCTLSGNSACGSDIAQGGGADSCTLYNCTLADNSSGEGGGAYGSTLHNCTLTGNSTGWSGGGAYSCTLYNCMLTDNSTGGSGGGA